MISKGPYLPQNSSHQLCYRSNSFSGVQSQSDISVEMRQVDESRSNRLPNRKQKLFEKLGSHNISQKIVQGEKPSQRFIKLFFKNRMIERFKRNLFQRAYVLPSLMKTKILQDPCLINKNQRQNSQRVSKFIIQPTTLTYWDPICILETIISLWLSPFISSFQNIDQVDFDGILILLIILIFVDIFINFNKAIIIQGEVISERYFIIIHYLKNSAFEDCISVILWIIIFNNVINNELIPIIQVIISIKRLIRKFEEYMESHYLKGQIGNILDLVILITSIYFFAHITACIWHYIGQKTIESGSWLTYYEIQDQSSWVKYNFSFYFATMTMITVGYGDITPKNQYEMIFTNGIMLISSCIFGYSMSAIGNILKSINDNKSKFKRSMILINSFMSRNQVDQSIQRRIRSYLKYLSESENSDNIEDINSIVNELPKGLQTELHSDISLRIVNNMQILTKNFTKPTQELLTEIMIPLKCTPSEIICKQGAMNSDLYYIDQGQVEIFELQSNRVLETLGAGQTFGEYQFFTGFASKISAMSLGFSKLYKINRSCFMENIQFIQKDFERFHSIKDQISFSQNYCVLLKNCKICLKYNHFIEDCPQLIYKPDLEKLLVITFNGPQQNKRKKYFRNERRINSKGMLHQIKQSVQNYQVSYHQNISQLDDINQIESNITNDDKPPSYHTPTIQICRTNKSQLSKIVQISDQNRRSYQYISQNCESLINAIPEKTMLDEFHPHVQYNDLQFDLMRNYTYYLPHNNLLDNLKLKEIYQKIHRIMNLKKFKELAQYTLSYALKLKILKFKQQIQNLIDLDI